MTENKRLAESESWGPVSQLSIRAVLLPLLKSYRLVGAVVLICAGLGVLHFLTATPRYESALTVLPDRQGSNSLLQGLGDLGALTGIQLPGASDPSLIYPEVLRSDRILSEILSSIGPSGSNFQEALGFEATSVGKSRAMKYLRRHIKVRRDNRTKIIKVTASMESAEFAHHVATTLAVSLDKYFRMASMNSAREMGLALDGRLSEIAVALDAAESRLAEFLVKNRQVTGVPILQMEADRLKRGVLIQETMFIEVTRQRELMRITENKDLKVINILDEPVKPDEPVFPRPLQSVVLGAILGLILAISFVYFRIYIYPYLKSQLQADLTGSKNSAI
jgi:uncharacterized protein involved in exopolysaccharide biosynthesis